MDYPKCYYYIHAKCHAILSSTEIMSFSGFSALKYNYLKFSTPTQEGPTAGEYSEPQINKDLLPPDKKAFQVAKGSPVIVLKCESSGSPVPTITWYKVRAQNIFVQATQIQSRYLSFYANLM